MTVKMCRIWGLSLVFFLVLALAACGGDSDVSSISKQVDPDRLIPAQANFIAKVQVGQILRDLDLVILFSGSPKGSDYPQGIEEFMELARKTGVDLREFETAIIFGDLSREDKFVGTMAKGSFEQATLLAAFENDGEMELVPEFYKGQEIHVDDTKDNPLALGFLSDEVLLIGTVPAVRAVIDVQVGDSRPATGKMVASYEALGDPLFKMAMVVPPEALAQLEEEMGDGGFVPIAFEAVQDLDLVILVVDRPGLDLKIEAQLSFNNPDSAAEIGNTLIGFLALGKAFAPDKQAQELLQKLEIAVADATITIRFQAPLADLKEVASGLGNDTSSNSGY